MTEIFKILLFMMAVAGLNEHFEHQQKKRKHKNSNQEMKMDSVIMVKFDSVLTQTYRK